MGGRKDSNQMIDPKELRIGNFVLVDGRITLVESITKTGINFTTFQGESYWEIEFKDIEPIPLTSKILTEWYGFEKVDNHFRFENWFRLKTEKDYWVYFIETDFGNDEDDISTLKHLHELQNLFFALTKKELEIIVYTSDMAIR